MQAEKEITLEDTTPDPNQPANGMPAAQMDVSMPATPVDVASDASIQDGLKTTEKNFKALQVALETYSIDHNNYPEKLDDLVKPIAYIRALPTDPFSPDKSAYHYRAEKEGGYTLWSVGPDQKDDNAQTKFDPSGDPKAKGDIVFTPPAKKKK
ncbi:MAG TPA: type II secretion system protein GspG [Candidatus Sumerlaeota bacterium]|nr:type II secretion system protein GspG [Candidatus Sumerlaeota bacterium]HPS00006.1 type II secretion system protein GspG [Candidatus Sumerlaeota bacterium]